MCNRGLRIAAPKSWERGLHMLLHQKGVINLQAIMHERQKDPLPAGRSDQCAAQVTCGGRFVWVRTSDVLSEDQR